MTKVTLFSVGAREEFVLSFITRWWYWYLKRSTTPDKIVLRNRRKRTLGKRLAIHLLYRAPSNKSTKAENNIIIFLKITVFNIHVNLTFALSIPFHEQHVRGMQIYEKLILHVQIEQEFSYPVGSMASKSFFKYKLSKQITYFAFKIMLS